jgi:salicylate hydroxylase
MAGLPLIIVGGGIGGLAAALALARVGRPVIVLERARQMAELGAGIQIAPNAFHCFDALGIGEQARKVAVYVDYLRLMDGISGEQICAVPLDHEFRAFFGNPYAVVHRADLHRVLLEACEEHPDIVLKVSQNVTGYIQDSDGVSVFIDKAEGPRGLALIGADGLNSVIREQVIGDGPPIVSGHTTYRSVIPAEAMPEDLRWNAPTLWAGPRCHIVHYPLSGGTLYNLVVTYHNDVSEAVAGLPVPTEEVARGFGHVHPRARQVIEHGKDWKLWVLCDRLPDPTWTDGRVVLLGDAAHPMLQYMAQGAAQAMEDAVVLGQCVGAVGHAGPDLAQAFASYRDHRFPRTAKVQTGSRLVGQYIYHAEAGHAAMRDAIMAAKTPAEWNRDFAWLFGRDALSRV